MIRYLYTKLKLLILLGRVRRSERKITVLRSKLTTIETLIATGFTNEKQFAEFNKRLIENRKCESDPDNQKRLDELRKKHFNGWRPKKRFKDSKDRTAIRDGGRRSGYVRIIKNRPLTKNPEDSKFTVIQSDIISEQKG